ncbi:MAG: N-acetyl-gamma-glutamyl-phosphate reductase [Burkholderiales bacterium]|nr:N-acetyl-gamma-glutamyl-phosphate reductase [Burkholderiales bacterium]
MNIGIVGVTGFGGSELLRLVLGHPTFKLAYVGGESSAGQRLDARFPALAGHAAGALIVEAFVPERLGAVDLLFASLPTGKSREPLSRVPARVRIVDVGGDHRFVDGWTYGLTELPGARAAVRGATRVANPGCFPAAALLPLAPLLRHGLIEPSGIVIDAKSGVTGTGRGGASDFGYVETSEDVFAYGLAGHPHVPEMEAALSRVAGSEARIAFTPHIVPMKRGILATCYARPRAAVSKEALLDAARADYASEPFIRIVSPERGRSAHTSWTAGSNLAFLTYDVNERTGLVVATGAIDNLGKGAAAQAVQNANLMAGVEETAGLTGQPLWP